MKPCNYCGREANLHEVIAITTSEHAFSQLVCDECPKHFKLISREEYEQNCRDFSQPILA
jgi:hypothetical protein